MEELQILTVQTREELKKIQDKAQEIRASELQEKAVTYIAEDKLPIGKALNILIEQE